MSRRGAQLLVFSTSAAVLVLEILAGRLMAPYVGVSIETFTGIIGTILAGIALGNYVGGRLADSIPPRKALGPALIVGGLLSWASLPIVSAVGVEMRNSGSSSSCFIVSSTATRAASGKPATASDSVVPGISKFRGMAPAGVSTCVCPTQTTSRPESASPVAVNR